MVPVRWKGLVSPMSLPTAIDGVVQTSLNSPVSWNEGLGYDSTGNLCVTTTVTGSDTFLSGKRVTQSGQLVIGPGNPPARPYVFNSGWPTDSRPAREGVTIAQGGTPAPTDPRIAGGIAVGPLGGVYMSTGA